MFAMFVRFYIEVDYRPEHIACQNKIYNMELFVYYRLLCLSHTKIVCISENDTTNYDLLHKAILTRIISESK